MLPRRAFISGLLGGIGAIAAFLSFDWLTTKDSHIITIIEGQRDWFNPRPALQIHYRTQRRRWFRRVIVGNNSPLRVNLDVYSLGTITLSDIAGLIRENENET